jgi:SAM-dependent methyltransferase
MRLLDCGCGPGSITLGLATAVAPADAIGVDRSARAIELANALTKAQGVANASFREADVHALPFESETFDAVFAHALLQHLPDPQRAVTEMARVLKPGGVIALADFDYGGCLLWPRDSMLDLAADLMGKLHAADGRSPYVGRTLASLLHAAGLERVTPRASVGLETPELGSHLGTLRYFEAEPVRDYIVALDLARDDEVRAIAPALERWAQTPGAVWTRYAWSAVGWKPLS